MHTEQRYSVNRTRFVRDVVADQYEYYAGKENDALAERWAQSVIAAVDSLRVMGERGTNCKFNHKRLKGMRWIAVPDFPFRIFYFVEKELRLIRTVHLLHDKQAAERILVKASRHF